MSYEIKHLTSADGIGIDGTLVANGSHSLSSSNQLKGGLHHFNTIVERDNISALRIEVGMLAYVLETDLYYRLKWNGLKLVWIEKGCSEDLINDLDNRVKALENTVIEKWIHKERPTGLIDGNNKTFHLSNNHKIGTDYVWIDAFLMVKDENYTINGCEIIFDEAIETNEIVRVSYQIDTTEVEVDTDAQGNVDTNENNEIII